MAGVNIYHIKRPDFSGIRLYPLNRLKDMLPGIYESAVKKYEGREWLMGVTIPTLGCLWNDVLHFSLMHPSVIYKNLMDVGIDYSARDLVWFEVPLRDALQQPTTLYLNTTKGWQDDKIMPPSDFEPVTSVRVGELSGMPAINLEYYRESFAKGERPLLWKRAPHVLVKGDLDISGYKTFDWRE